MTRRDTPHESLSVFLADKCDATRARYDAELANAGSGWTKPLDFWYAESLVFFGLLERSVETITSESGRVLGSRCRFRKPPECTSRLCKSEEFQTEAAL